MLSVQSKIVTIFLSLLGCAALHCLTPRDALAVSEAVVGDFSSNPAAPTPVTFVVGNNQVAGSVTNLGDTRDCITFTIAPGQRLTGLLLQSYVALPGTNPGNRGYHALAPGATTVIPSGANSSSFLGGDHLDFAPAGTDLLPRLAAATLAGVGFTRPLGPGTYTYLVQQTGADHSGYDLTFVVAPVAAVPATHHGLLVGAGALMAALALWQFGRRSIAVVA